MKVRITSCSARGYWYEKKIGKVFTIETKPTGKPVLQEENSAYYYRVIFEEMNRDKKGNANILIEKRDCVVE